MRSLWDIVRIAMAVIVVVLVFAFPFVLFAVLPLLLLWETWRLSPRRRRRRKSQFRLSSLFVATAAVGATLAIAGDDVDRREPVSVALFLALFVVLYSLVTLLMMFFWDAFFGYTRFERSASEQLRARETDVTIAPPEPTDENEPADSPPPRPKRPWWAKKWPNRYVPARAGKDHTVPMPWRGEDD